MSQIVRKVLIVDDEPMVAETTRRTLVSLLPSLEVITCTDSKKALGILREAPIAVLLCDLQMPMLDGVAVMHEAYKANPHTVSILITAYATKDSMIRALNDGRVWRCLEKPWNPMVLVEMVEEAVNLYAERVAGSTPKPTGKPAPPGKGKIRVGKGPRLPELHRKIVSAIQANPKLGPPHRMAPRKVLPRPGSSTPPPKTLSGERLAPAGRYRNMTLLAKGGMGAVYKADDTLLHNTVAIKVLSEDVARDEEAIEMLLDEARIAMQLSHKHIVRLHNLEEVQGTYQIIMEYIEGCTFRKLLRDSGAFPLDMVSQIVEICDDALGYAHRRNVYHRDLKPDNLMLRNDGVTKIIDFGLACLKEKQRHSGQIQGTPYYISPEEIHGGPLDQRADVYSLGIMLHEFILGELPKHAGGEVPANVFDFVPRASSRLPGNLQAVLQKSFATEPKDRWDDVHALATAFRNALP